MPVTSIASPFALHCLENVHQKQGSRASCHNAPLMLEQGCPSSCNNRALFKVSALKLRILLPIQLSMKTFISYNQLQNKSLRQIMFFFHFPSPLSPFNTKCPWFKKKKSRRNSLLFFLDLCLPLLCSKNSLKKV